MPSKALLRKTVIPAIVALVAIASFGLGRLSSLEEGRGVVMHVQEHKASLAAPVASEHLSPNPPQEIPHAILASKNGTKYYLPTCKNNISEENKVWFGSAREAQAAGYAPAANCKGVNNK